MEAKILKRNLFTRIVSVFVVISFIATSAPMGAYALRPVATDDTIVTEQMVDDLTQAKSAKIIKRIGILTGGGPASGHNVVILSALRQAQKEGIELVAIWEGWKGLTDDKVAAKARPLTLKDVVQFAEKGGTVLVTSRENPYSKDNVAKGAPQKLWENIQKLQLDALITCGGDDTNSVSFKLQQEHPDFPIMGLPKTMDNDIALPEPDAQTYGFDSFIQAATPRLEDGRTDAVSTKRVLVVEVFGRAAGFVASRLGANVLATRTLIPEEQLDLEKFVADVKSYYAKHKYGVVVVSEGVSINKDFANNAKILEMAFAKDARSKYAFESVKDKDAFGNPKLEDAGLIINAVLAANGVSTSRAGKIDYLFRSASTSKFDTEMCVLLGTAAVENLSKGEKNQILYVHNNKVKSLVLTPKLGGRKFDYQGVDREEYLKANQVLLEASVDNGEISEGQAMFSNGTLEMKNLEVSELANGKIRDVAAMWDELKVYVEDGYADAENNRKLIKKFSKVTKWQDGLGIGYLYSIIKETASTILEMSEYVNSLFDAGITTVVYSGEGGQILGNRALFEALGTSSKVKKFIWANNLKSRADLKLKEEGEGGLKGKADEVLFIASSKSGSTDETAFNTQSMLRYFIIEFAERHGVNARDLLEKLQGKDGKGKNIAKDVVAGDVVDGKLKEDIRNKIFLSLGIETASKERELLDEVAKHIVFTTTQKTDKSALYKLALLLGIKTYNIPTAIGGRYSVLSESGNITSLLAGFGREIAKKMNDMVGKLVESFSKHDPEKNPALKCALALNSKIEEGDDPRSRILVGVSNSGKIHSILEWMGQLVMESVGKEGIGPYFITAEGQEAFEDIKNKQDAKKNYVYFIVNVEGEGLSKIKLEDDDPRIVYNIKNLDGENLARFFVFCQELIVRYGLLNFARQEKAPKDAGTKLNTMYGEVADPKTKKIDGRNTLFRTYDAQDQLAVEEAKTAAQAVAEEISKKSIDRRKEDLVTAYNASPSLVEDAEPGAIVPKGHRINGIYVYGDISESYKTQLDDAVKKTQVSNNDNNVFLEDTVKKIEELLEARRNTQEPKKISEIDQEISKKYASIADFGKGRQEDTKIENLAQVGAKMLFAVHGQEAKITTLFLYSPYDRTDIFGEWWKMLGRKAGQGMLYDYMMGTRDQHSRQQGLIDGPDLAFTIFVRFVEEANKVFPEIADEGQYGEQILSNGMVKEHMNGLYPSEMLDAYFEGISRAFAKKHRDLAKMSLPTIDNKDNLPVLFRLFGRMNELYREMLVINPAASSDNGMVNEVDNAEAIKASLKGIVEIIPGGVRIIDEKALREKLIDDLVENATFNPNPEVVKICRQLIKDIAAAQGAVLDSVYPLYAKKSKDKRHYSVPAINVRGMGYDTARAAIKSAMKNDVGAVIFEIAKSEIKYTGQRPAEFTTSILAAAIKEGYNRPVYLQADHFQVALKDYEENPAKAIGAIKDLIRESIEAGFYQVDLDMSPLVDFTKATPSEQQRLNYELTAYLTVYVRQLERELGLDKLGIVVNLGGEIGEIGKGVDKKTQKNSTKAELRAFNDGYKNELTQPSKDLGYTILPITKVAIQTGTIHGGIRDAKGEPLGAGEISLSFNTLAECNEVCRNEYDQAGAVQHGASTLPEQFFIVFSGEPVPEGLAIDEKLLSEENKKVLGENPTAEVHLATAYQDTILENKSFPVPLFDRIREYISGLPDYKKELDKKKTPEEAFASTRKNAWGKFKPDVWHLPGSIKSAIRDSLEIKFDTVFKNLGVKNLKSLLPEAKWGQTLLPFAEAFHLDIIKRLSPQVISINEAKDGKPVVIMLNHEALLKTSPDGIIVLENFIRQLGEGNIKFVLHVVRSDIKPVEINTIIDEDFAKLNQLNGGYTHINRGMFAAVVVGINADEVVKQVKEKVNADVSQVIGPAEYAEQFKGVMRIVMDRANKGQITQMSKALRLGLELIGMGGQAADEDLKKLDALFSVDAGTFRVAPTGVTTSTEEKADAYKKQVEAELRV